ncbi:MAG: hypothetical protein Q9168_003271 [Polycauliona sp. 1 TL-2023]
MRSSVDDPNLFYIPDKRALITSSGQCFSSLERLRLAQRPVSSETGTTSSLLFRCPSTTRPASRPSRPTLRSRNSSYFKASPGRLARKTSVRSDGYSFEDAQWFQRLPDKVQRKQFTKEEQRVLTGYRESLILDAGDQVVLRARRQTNRSVPTRQVANSVSSTSSVHTLEDERPVDSAMNMEESILDSFRWMDDDDDLDLTLDDYHCHLVSSAEPASIHSSRRPSFRRTSSLTGLPRGESNNSQNPAREGTSRSRRPSSPVDPVRRGSSPSRADRCDATSQDRSTVRNIEPATKHYKDPEARLKLRVYLASPSKFDEALEFGFPSLDSIENLPLPPRPSLSRTYHTEPIPQTFYDSENPSFLDGFDSDSDDAESLPEMDTPHTPSDAIFFRSAHPVPNSKAASSDLDRLSPKPVAKWSVKQKEPSSLQHHPYASAGCNREMTLRMTLTRSDLRASEDLLYGAGDNDPLALEHLPSPVAANDMWEQSKEGGGTVKKFWRRVSRR